MTPTAAPATGPSVGPIHIIDATETCNIGPGELRRRRQGFGALAIATLAVIALIPLGVLPATALPFVAPLIGGLVVSGLQVRNRFCVNFGVRGVVGMGTQAGESPAARELLAAHRRRALGMVGWGALATVAWFAAAWLLVAR